DDAAARIELDGDRRAQIADHPLGRASFWTHPPDVVGSQQREVEKTVGPGLERVGQREILEQHARRAARQIELQQATLHAALVDEQSALVERDAIRARYVVAQHARAAVAAYHAHPRVHHLGDVEIAARIERDVVGRNDLAAHLADRLQPTRGDVEG